MCPAANHEHDTKTRVQIDMSSNEIQRLNWIMEVCDLNTRKELFNNALTLLHWATKETVQGRKIASFNDATKDRYILSMPALNAAAAWQPERAKAEASTAQADECRAQTSQPRSEYQNCIPLKA